MFKILGGKKKKIGKMHFHSWVSFLLFAFYGVWKQKVSFPDQSKDSDLFKPANLSSLQGFFTALILSCRCSVHYSMIICICMSRIFWSLFFYILWSFLQASGVLSSPVTLLSKVLISAVTVSNLSSRKIIEICNLSLPYCNCKSSSKQNNPYLIDSYFVTLWLKSIQKWYLVH